MPRSLPTIYCPECKTVMMASKPKLVLFTRGLEEVAYSCPSCDATTVRSIKPNQKEEIGAIAPGNNKIENPKNN